MDDSSTGLPTVDLQPGELYVARQTSILRTILGSCVGATIWSPQLGVGALCHGVLPKAPFPWEPASRGTDGHRFVDFSIRYLVEQFDSLGAARLNLVVKLFGGADVLPVGSNRQSRPTVGALNCRVAIEVLSELGLPVSASDLGGNRGRRIQFHTGTGEVLLHRLAAWRDKDCTDSVHTRRRQ